MAQCPSDERIAGKFADGQAAEAPLQDAGGQVPRQPPAAEAVLGGVGIIGQPVERRRVVNFEDALGTGPQRGEDAGHDGRLLVPQPRRHEFKHLCQGENEVK